MWSLLGRYVLPFLQILFLAISSIGLGREFGWERAYGEVHDIAEKGYIGKIPLEDIPELFKFHLLYVEAIDLVGKTPASVLESQNPIN